MSSDALIDLYFDKGNGAVFSVEHQGQRVRCFVQLDNAFLARKASPGESFPSIFKRYAAVIAHAAAANIARSGVSTEPWGNLITGEDIEIAQDMPRRAV